MSILKWIDGMYKKYNMPETGDIVGYSRRAIREYPYLAGVEYTCKGSHWGSPYYHCVMISDEDYIWNEYWRLIRRA